MPHATETIHHFEVISPLHIVSSFSCENTYLTNYIRTRALEETRQSRARTFVCLDEGASPSEAIIGYFTLRASGYWIGSLFVPVVELMCLARRMERRGEDWGNILLSEALSKVSLASELIGISGIELESTAQGRSLYTAAGFGAHPFRNNFMYLPKHSIPVL